MLKIKTGIVRTSDKDTTYLKGLLSTELNTMPASFPFMQESLVKKEEQFIKENGFDKAKASIVPVINNKELLKSFFKKNIKKIKGIDTNAVILVPVANPKRTDERIRFVLLPFSSVIYLIKKKIDPSNKTVR